MLMVKYPQTSKKFAREVHRTFYCRDKSSQYYVPSDEDTSDEDTINPTSNSSTPERDSSQDDLSQETPAIDRTLPAPAINREAELIRIAGIK
jgi:hypothetical protein